MRKLFLAALMVSGLLYLAGCGMSDDTVATVGGTKISANAFKQTLSRRYSKKDSYASVDSAAKMTMLNNMIERELKANAGHDMGLDSDPSFQGEYKAQEARVLGNRYFERVVVDKLFPESVIRAEFEKQKEQVKASHVLISYKGARGGKSTLSKEQALALAKEVSKKAKNGEDFAKLAVQYSNDPSAKQNKGDLGFFTWGRMVPAFQEAAFKMKPGDISDPVESAFGFHVIKVTDRQPNPNFDESKYESEKYNIKRRVYFTKKDSGMAMWKRQQAKLEKQNDFKIIEENLNQIIAASKAKPGSVNPANFSDEQKALPLAQWDGGALTLNNIFTLYGSRVSMLGRKLSSLATFKTEVRNAALQDLIIKDAQRMGITDEADIKAQLQDAKNAKLASLAEKKAVRGKAEVSEDEVKAYYAAHNKEFVRPAEMEIWEIYLKDQKKAKKVAAKAHAGRNFEKLATKYSEDNFYKKKKGYLGFKAEKRRGEVSREAFKLGPNKIGGPIKYRAGWAVFKTGKLKPESLRSLEEVHTQVKTKVQNSKIKELRDAWNKELHKKYPVKINTKIVEKI